MAKEANRGMCEVRDLDVPISRVHFGSLVSFFDICHMFISLSAVRELTRSIGRWLVKTHGEDLAIGVNSLKM